jgi:hypothetical protein
MIPTDNHRSKPSATPCRAVWDKLAISAEKLGLMRVFVLHEIRPIGIVNLIYLVAFRLVIWVPMPHLSFVLRAGRNSPPAVCG